MNTRQMINILSNLESETDQYKKYLLKIELAKNIYGLAFNDDADRKTIKKLVDDDILDELFSDLNKIGNYIKVFVSQNIRYIEEDYRDTPFLETIQNDNKELEEVTSKLNRLRKELDTKKSKRNEIQKHKNEIEKYSSDIEEIDSILQEYGGRDIESLKREYEEQHEKYFSKYKKSPKETREELDQMQADIDGLNTFYSDYEASTQKLEQLSREFETISELNIKHEELLKVYRTHFDANMLLDAKESSSLAESIEKDLKEFDENIKETMELIKQTQQKIREKQR